MKTNACREVKRYWGIHGVQDSWRRWLAVGLLVTVVAVFSIAVAQARQCDGTPVWVKHRHSVDADLVCSAAKSTFEFMRRNGFGATKSITVQVLDQPAEAFRNGELGRFDGNRRETLILSFAVAQIEARDSPPFNTPMNKELYQSFVVHELAHAIAHSAFEIARPSVVAQEYIAYTVQLATMPPALREEILARYRVDAFADESEMSELYYAFDPCVFAVKAYRHFMTLSEPQAFYKRLLTGAFQPENTGTWW